jgi:hypothetical protein
MFKSMAVALKELERFVRDGKQLETGKPIPNFERALPREVWGNWLVCAACNFEVKEERFVLCSEPTGGDGIILDKDKGESWPTEHVIARTPANASAPDSETEILKAITRKNGKGGAAYASGKTLVVFTNLPNGNEWYPNRVMKKLPNTMQFGAVWIVSFQKCSDGEYLYGVVSLEVGEQGAIMYSIRINKDFTGWTVERVQ